MQNIQRLIGLSLLVGLMASQAHAVSVPQWNNMPVACTPARLVEWQAGVNEENQAPCHCPPPAMCPTSGTGDAFINNDKLPSSVTVKCCQPPKCPAGTLLAGEPIPTNGDCASRPSCPWGFSPFTGRLPVVGDVTNLCLPTCPDEYFVTAADDWLGPAWDAEGVLFTEHDGQFIACQSVVYTNDCLHGSSKVMLANSKSVAIETLKVGDLIKGPGGEVRVAAVNQLTQKAMYYRVNDFDFKLTGEHPLQTTDGWKSPNYSNTYSGTVGRLEVGDVLVTSKGEVKVTSIEVERTKVPERSINIRVDQDQPFYVDGVAVKPFKDMQFSY